MPSTITGPAAAITSYRRDFGDGSSATDIAPGHTYAGPGTYTVTLTVHSGALSAQDQATVAIAPVPPTPGLGVTVKAASSPVPGADVLVIKPDGTRISAITASDGTARLNGLGDGAVTVYAHADGFQPAVATATVADGSGQVEINLTSGDVGVAQLGSRRLTIDEIIGLGIDPNDPDNQNIYEFEINPFFVALSDDVPPPLNLRLTTIPTSCEASAQPHGGQVVNHARETAVSPGGGVMVVGIVAAATSRASGQGRLGDWTLDRRGERS